MSNENVGRLEDVGKSLLICDNEACEAMFSFDRRHDGDPCPECEDKAGWDDVPSRFHAVESVDANGLRTIVAMANHYGRQ